ncbi:MAG: hypothetical protein MZV63_12400 [Marinilabiliales bacterium]|nr:hypothetical protein [Marinilabiliales bacterium]
MTSRKLNNEVLKMWDDNNTFHRSLRSRDGKGEFVFYEGPPPPTACPEYTTSCRAPSRTPSAATRRCRATR